MVVRHRAIGVVKEGKMREYCPEDHVYGSDSVLWAWALVAPVISVFAVAILV